MPARVATPPASVALEPHRRLLASASSVLHRSSQSVPAPAPPTRWRDRSALAPAPPGLLTFNRSAVSFTVHPSASILSRINSPRCGGSYIVAIALPPRSVIVDQAHVYGFRSLEAPGCRPDSGGARRRCRPGRAGPPWSSHSVCSVATHGPGRAGTGPRRARRSGSRRRAYVHRAHTRTTRTLEHHQGGSLSTNSYATALQGRAPSRRPTAASRRGRRHVGAYVPPDVAQRLRVLAAQEDTSTQALIVEAIEMLFRSRRGGGGVG